MPPITEQSDAQGRIMVVDDQPLNLKVLEEMLRRHRYEVRSFPLGRLALASAMKQTPDLVLLDVNMPEMNGYEVCERMKSTPQLCDVPVIFLSALNETEDKVKGFRSGGADFVSKPFRFEEVQARVETHLKLRRAQQTERDLLERTLGGAVTALLELVQVTSPMLVLRTHSVRDIMQWLAKGMDVKDAWQYELAAKLCLVGCIAMPNVTFAKAYADKSVSADEDHVFRSHPAIAVRLLSNIPRLESVVEIIRRQQMAGPDMSASEQVRQGAQMLHLALELDRKMFRDVECHTAIKQLRDAKRFDEKLLDVLAGYRASKAEFDLRSVRIRELRPGMVLDEDVLTVNPKTLIMKEGSVLTPVWIERLENFKQSHGMQEQIRVRAPRLKEGGE